MLYNFKLYGLIFGTPRCGLTPYGITLLGFTLYATLFTIFGTFWMPFTLSTLTLLVSYFWVLI